MSERASKTLEQVEMSVKLQMISKDLMTGCNSAARFVLREYLVRVGSLSLAWIEQASKTPTADGTLGLLGVYLDWGFQDRTLLAGVFLFLLSLLYIMPNCGIIISVAPPAVLGRR